MRGLGDGVRLNRRERTGLLSLRGDFGDLGRRSITGAVRVVADSGRHTFACERGSVYGEANGAEDTGRHGELLVCLDWFGLGSKWRVSKMSKMDACPKERTPSVRFEGDRRVCVP